MYIKINNVVIQNADWRVNGETGELRFETDEGIAAIQDIYNPETEVLLEEYNDDDTLKAQWYLRNLVSVKYWLSDVTGRWELHVQFKMSANPISEIEDIRTAAEDTDDGIFELAEIINDISEQIEGIGETITAQQSTLNRLSELYDAIADRVARLENK